MEPNQKDENVEPVSIFSPLKTQKPKEQFNKTMGTIDADIMKRALEVKEKLQRNLQSKQKEVPQELVLLLKESGNVLCSPLSLIT